jgi:hypothetical protein
MGHNLDLDAPIVEMRNFAGGPAVAARRSNARPQYEYISRWRRAAPFRPLNGTDVKVDWIERVAGRVVARPGVSVRR